MKYQSNSYPFLTKSYKNFYPFKIGTTSFIYPDHYVPNVKMLGPYLDEIELLLFESKGTDALPAQSVITELSRMGKDLDLTYNIHLPTDISISDPDPNRQIHAVDTMNRVIELVYPLNPSALTLHLPYVEGFFNEYTVKSWQDRVHDNLEKILSAVVPKDKIAIETLDYSFELVDDIIVDLDLKVCIDLGISSFTLIAFNASYHCNHFQFRKLLDQSQFSSQ